MPWGDTAATFRYNRKKDAVSMLWSGKLNMVYEDRVLKIKGKTKTRESALTKVVKLIEIGLAARTVDLSEMVPDIKKLDKLKLSDIAFEGAPPHITVEQVVRKIIPDVTVDDLWVGEDVARIMDERSYEINLADADDMDQTIELTNNSLRYAGIRAIKGLTGSTYVYIYKGVPR